MDANALKGGIVFIALGVVGLIVAICLFSSYTTIDAGHVGVVKRFGAVDETSLNEGLHWMTPFIVSVAQMDTRISTVANSAQASSKDLQEIQTTVSVQYYIIGAMAPQLYQKIGIKENIESTILPAIEESVKAVVAKYTASSLVTKREIVKVEIRKQLESYIMTTLKSKGIDSGIKLANVAITNFQFSEKFNEAIEKKVRAGEEAEQAKREKERRKTIAEAKAEEQKIGADAEAYMIKKQSEARSAAIKAEASALKNNPALIQLRLAEKWDGVLPQFSGAGGNMLLDVGKIMNSRRTNVHARRLAGN